MLRVRTLYAFWEETMLSSDFRDHSLSNSLLLLLLSCYQFVTCPATFSVADFDKSSA